jgi:hypothetical protein
MEPLLKEGERIDNIGFGNLRLIQKPGDFCYGIDAVLLATVTINYPPFGYPYYPIFSKLNFSMCN